jgi:hypothetical protein
MKRLRRPLLLVLGVCAVAAASFFGTLFVLDYLRYGVDRDQIRAEDAASLKAALAKYRAVHGSYPSFPDNPVSDLKTALVLGGLYISSIPDDPLWAKSDKQYRYAGSGTSYGLLFHLEKDQGKILAGGACLTGVGTAGVGYWGSPPDCPF